MSDIPARFSLLFEDNSLIPETLYDAQTLAFLAPLPADKESIPTIEHILSLRTTRKDITFRKEILEDFLQYPSLLTKCESICRKWEGLQETAKREREALPDMAYEQILSILKENSVSLMEHLRFLRRSADEMSNETPDSRGLFAFAEFLRLHADSNAVRSLTEQVSKYPLLRPENARAVLQANLDKQGKKTSVDLLYLGKDDSKYLRKIPFRKEDFTADLPKHDALEQTTEAIRRLANKFQTVTQTIRDAFLPLQEGMIFYHTALSITEWAGRKGYPWQFAVPVAEQGPEGKNIRDLQEMLDGKERPALSFMAKPLESYEGDWGTQTLKAIARTHIFAAAGLPVVAESAVFSPEERIVIYDSEAKTMDNEIEALAKIFHNTRKKDIVLLNQPLITVGNAPAAEIVKNLLHAFLKKGAKVRLATDLSVY